MQGILFYVISLSLYILSINFIGLLLLYFISVYNHQAVNKKEVPSLIQMLRMKRKLDLDAK